MVSGDDKVCLEAASTVKGIYTAEVKKGLDTECARFLPAEKARILIRDTAAKAVKNHRKIKPLKIKAPVSMKIEYVSRIPLPIHKTNVKVVSERTVESKASSVETALYNLAYS
jgi:D-aminopeptidase